MVVIASVAYSLCVEPKKPVAVVHRKKTLYIPPPAGADTTVMFDVMANSAVQNEQLLSNSVKSLALLLKAKSS